MSSPVHIIGAGLAGSEAAHFLASQGIDVVLHEMRPRRLTEAHKTGGFAELVCSNSLKSQSPVSAPGILKAEMREIGSLVLQAAEKAAVPGGEALTVDRDVFSEEITRTLRAHPRIRVEEGELSAPPEGAITLLATGPLTSEALCRWIVKATGERDLYFYDAIAPIIDASTIDRDHCWLANRYGKGGEEAYLNCPLTRDEYEAFIDALLAGEKVTPKNFEKEKFFAGCQPIEAIAATGRESLRFGPMKPVGLLDPRPGREGQRPHAVIQLRAENLARSAYNMVGFQTKLKWGEQSRIFRLIPALRKAEFLRLGSIHRNTYVCGPKVLRPDLSLKKHPRVYLAGQLTGVEGYLESAACGLLAALFITQRVRGQPHSAPPLNTGLGALLRHVILSDPENYQPNNMQFALFETGLYADVESLKKDALRAEIAQQSLARLQVWARRS